MLSFAMEILRFPKVKIVFARVRSCPLKCLSDWFFHQKQYDWIAYSQFFWTRFSFIRMLSFAMELLRFPKVKIVFARVRSRPLKRLSVLFFSWKSSIWAYVLAGSLNAVFVYQNAEFRNGIIELFESEKSCSRECVAAHSNACPNYFLHENHRFKLMF